MSGLSIKKTKVESVVAVKDQVSCVLDGDTVILHLGTGTYYGLNAVGTAIWNLIQEPRTIEEIHRRLLQRYDTNADECERDLQDLLDELGKARLIEIRDAGSE